MQNLQFFEKAVKVFYIQPINKTHKREIYRTSLLVQCLRICLSMDGGHGFSTGPRRLPHSAEQLSRKAELLKLHSPELVFCNKRIHPSEKPVHCNEERPHLPQPEGPGAVKAQHSHQSISQV